MSDQFRTVVMWSARVAGCAVSAFLSMFALDAFTHRPFFSGLLDFAIHLVPAAVCAAVVAIAWRRPWIGAGVFGALAVAYAASVPTHPNWIVAISGPLALVAALFALDAGLRGRRTAAA